MLYNQPFSLFIEPLFFGQKPFLLKSYTLVFNPLNLHKIILALLFPNFLLKQLLIFLYFFGLPWNIDHNWLLNSHPNFSSIDQMSALNLGEDLHKVSWCLRSIIIRILKVLESVFIVVISFLLFKNPYSVFFLLSNVYHIF